MRRIVLCIVAAVAMSATITMAADNVAKDRQEAVKQSQKASANFRQIMGISDEEKKIPRSLLSDAECVAVFPDVIKAAFIFGGTGGKGVVSARDPKTGKWGPPLFLKLGGASWGAQIGGQSSDFILMGLNRDSIDTFTKSEWTLGADAAAVAGPVGRKASAQTNYKLEGKMLSYSRSKGLFAGVSLEGAKIKVDEDVNRAVYGDATPADILAGRAKMDPAAAAVTVYPQTLGRYSARTGH